MHLGKILGAPIARLKRQGLMSLALHVLDLLTRGVTLFCTVPILPTRWNTFRTMCDHSKKVGIALELTADLPEPEVLDQWFGEPIKACIVPTSIFLTNKKGYPVLSRAHQAVVKRLFKVVISYIINIIYFMYIISILHFTRIYIVVIHSCPLL